MDTCDVENAEKLSEDLVKGENDLGNGKLKEENEKLDEMDVDNEYVCKEVSVKDQSEVEKGADDQSHSARNGPSEILVEVIAPEKNALEDEKGIGRDSVEGEKGLGKDSVEEEKGTGCDSAKEEKGTGIDSVKENGAGRDSVEEEKSTGKDSVEEENVTGGVSVEEEKVTGKNSVEEENDTGKVSMEEQQVTGKDSLEEENGTGKVSMEEDKVSEKDSVEEEKGIVQYSAEEEDGIGRESVEEVKITGKESMEEKVTGKVSMEEEKVAEKESVEEEKGIVQYSVEEEDGTGRESVEEVKITGKESMEEKVTGKVSVEEEKVTEKESVEEKITGKESMEEDTEYFAEFPAEGEAEENKIDKGGIMVAETNVKTAVTYVGHDGKPGNNEVLENEDEADCYAVDENKEAASDSNYISGNKNDANGDTEMRQSEDNCLAADQVESLTPYGVGKYNSEKENGDTNDAQVFQLTEEEEAGTLEEQANFFTELEKFYKGRSIDFKAPKFYGQILNCLKLYRAVIRLGGYDRVTGLKLWRQVGESFHPPKTCTTVSWTFRIFYEKALLEYERHKLQNGELELAVAAVPEPIRVENENPGSGRARRDAAARAMQGWHAQRHYGYGEEKDVNNMPKREKKLKNIGSLKHKRQGEVEYPMKAARTETSKQPVATVVDVGPPADWVKINVRENKDCFEVYALVPGLLREEVRVQSDPAGRLVITGQPEQHENPWGITSFKKVISLPGRIDPLQTSAVVSLHGRLFVRVPFEQSHV